MRKIISIIIITLLCLSSMVFAEPYNKESIELKSGNAIEERNDKDIVKERTEKNKELIKKIKADKDFVVIYDDGEGNASFVDSNKSCKSKEELFAKISEYKAQYEYSDTLSGNDSIGYSNGRCIVDFDTDCTLNGTAISNGVLAFSGNSYAFWSGYIPQRADLIIQGDTFSCAYLGGSVSISYPPSATGQVVGSSLTVNYPQIENVNIYNHTYSNITFTAYIITKSSQANSATFKFGTDTVTPYCSDSHDY